MCLPQFDKDGKLGALVPPGSVYEVMVTPPMEIGCQPLGARLQVGMEHMIVLQGRAGGPKKYEGLLAFEDEQGLVTDAEKITQVSLVVRVRLGNLPPVSYGYPRGQWLEPSKLPFGFYIATADWDGKHYTFRPVWIRQDSPEVVVFKPGKIEPYETHYRGRVVHGVNGDPIAGAIIMPADASGIDEACLDSQALSRLEQQADPQTAKSDVAGRFEIALPIVTRPGPRHALIALKSDYLAFHQQRSLIWSGREGDKPRSLEFPTDKRGKVTLPELKLLPAGTLIVEPNAPTALRGRRIAVDFVITPDSPAWLAKLRAPPEENSGGKVVLGTDLLATGRQSLRVPAYAKLVLCLQLPDERYAPAFVENVTVAQGKTVDLGRIDFAQAVPVVVKVLDSNDVPLSGVTVTCLTGKISCPVGEATTDADGVAHLRIAHRSSGRFIAHRKDPQTNQTIQGQMPYDLACVQDASKEFTLRLPSEPPEQPIEAQRP